MTPRSVNTRFSDYRVRQLVNDKIRTQLQLGLYTVGVPLINDTRHTFCNVVTVCMVDSRSTLHEAISNAVQRAGPGNYAPCDRDFAITQFIAL